MADWCENKLYVFGPPDDLDAFAKRAHGEVALDLNSFVPIPEELRSTQAPNRDRENAALMMERYGHEDWDSWQRANWGIKSNCMHVTMRRVTDSTGEGSLTYEFDTPWEPFDQKVLDTMAAAFPTLMLELEYFGPHGCDGSASAGGEDPC